MEPEQILVEALEKIAHRRGFALDELRLAVGGEAALATSKVTAQMALEEYAKRKREWPDRETVLFNALWHLVRLYLHVEPGEQSHAPTEEEWHDAWVQAAHALAEVQFGPKAAKEDAK